MYLIHLSLLSAQAMWHEWLLPAPFSISLFLFSYFSTHFVMMLWVTTCDIVSDAKIYNKTVLCIHFHVIFVCFDFCCSLYVNRCSSFCFHCVSRSSLELEFLHLISIRNLSWIFETLKSCRINSIGNLRQNAVE